MKLNTKQTTDEIYKFYQSAQLEHLVKLNLLTEDEALRIQKGEIKNAQDLLEYREKCASMYIESREESKKCK